jgi:hypothetical protein
VFYLTTMPPLTPQVRYKAFDMDPYRVAEARELGLPVFFGDATRPEVLQVFMREANADISGVVVALDKPADCTKAVRALRRLYPTVDSMPIFVRANDEKHRRKLAASGATALETGPQESALLLGGAVLSRVGLPKEEVFSLIDDTRARTVPSSPPHPTPRRTSITCTPPLLVASCAAGLSMYSTRMKDVFGHDAGQDGKPRPGGLRNLLRSPAKEAAEKAAEIAKEIESEIETDIMAVAEEAAAGGSAGAEGVGNVGPPQAIDRPSSQTAESGAGS